MFFGVYGNKPNGIIPSSQDHQKQSDKWRLGSNSRPPNGVDNCQQHIGDKGDSHSGETFEWENVVQDTSMKPLVDELHANLTAIVKLGLVKPML